MEYIEDMTADEIYKDMSQRQIEDMKNILISEYKTQEIVGGVSPFVYDELVEILTDDIEPETETKVEYVDVEIDNYKVIDYINNMPTYLRRDFICDMLGLRHLVTNEEILKKIQEFV